MNSPKSSITVEQFDNPRFSSENAPDEKHRAKFTYQVKAAKNTLAVHRGQYLMPSEVQALIDGGIGVIIT